MARARFQDQNYLNWAFTANSRKIHPTIIRYTWVQNFLPQFFVVNVGTLMRVGVNTYSAVYMHLVDLIL